MNAAVSSNTDESSLCADGPGADTVHTYLVFKELVFQCFVTWIIARLFKQNTIFLQTSTQLRLPTKAIAKIFEWEGFDLPLPSSHPHPFPISLVLFPPWTIALPYSFLPNSAMGIGYGLSQ